MYWQFLTMHNKINILADLKKIGCKSVWPVHTIPQGFRL